MYSWKFLNDMEQTTKFHRAWSRRSMVQASVFLLCAQGGLSIAQNQYPLKPARIIVPFNPGGVTDLLGHIVAQGLSERMGKAFIVENRSGASGNVGAAAVAQAKPDGYTLLVGTIATQSVSSHLFIRPGFNAVTDFAPVTQIAEFPNVIGVNPTVPVSTLSEFIAYVRANPGKLNYGSTGNGGHSIL